MPSTRPVPDHDDRSLDEAIDETFPASDPPANTPETGVKLMRPDIPDDPRNVERESGGPGDRTGR